MMLDLQDFIVIAILIGCLVWIVRRIVRKPSGKNGCCSGCTAHCPMHDLPVSGDAPHQQSRSQASESRHEAEKTGPAAGCTCWDRPERVKKP